MKSKFKKYDVIRCKKDYRIIMGNIKKNYFGIELNDYTINDIWGRKIEHKEGTRFIQPIEIVDKYFKKIFDPS